MSDCGVKMKIATHRGKAGFRCTARPCGKRLSSVSGGLLEGSHLSEKEFLILAFFWAHDCAGVRAEEMLGQEAAELFDHMAAGSIVFGDSAKAYISAAASHGCHLSCVDHGHGEVSRSTSVAS